MQLRIQDPITGREQINDKSEPHSALAQFYCALNNRDFELMQKNWDASDEAVMDNPLGGIKRGWVEIREVYERLFRSDTSYHFEFYDYTIQRFDEVFLAIGRERGTLSFDGDSLDLTIRTSRIFRWRDGYWRQIHHHGSIDDPGMLLRYQQAVRKQAA